jgi:hypothetical protein
MKTKWLKAALGVAIFVSAVGASAKSIDLTTSSPGPTLTIGEEGFVPSTSVMHPGDFSTSWFFDVNPKTDFDIVVDITSNNTAHFGIKNLDAKLYDGTKLVRSGTDFSVTDLSGGDYKLIISGDSIVSGADCSSYWGNVKLTAVPLPAAAWLFLSGLAGVGLMARRRTAA